MGLPEYKLTIEASGHSVLDCTFNSEDQEAAQQIMSDIVISFAKHNALDTGALNANLYQTTWINGI